MKIAAMSILLLLSLLIACAEDEKPTTPAPTPEPTIDELVVENAEVFVLALEAYAAENDDVYPPSLSMPNLLGNTVIDFLPGGELLVNPVTGNYTDPVDGSAVNPGQVGYRSLFNSANLATGYLVDALAEDGSIIFEQRKDPT